MASVLSEESLDQLSDRFELDGYSLSADVSESESSDGSFSCLRVTQEGEASSSLVTSPFVNNEFSDESFSPAKIPVMLPVVGGRHVIIPPRNVEKEECADVSEVEMMKERFAKLLLGEDMSGGGKGVCAALAISNAITNLSASVFGKLWKLEPLPSQQKSMWVREMDWLLSVSDSIVELIPSLQDYPGGGTFEVMVPRPRSDLYMNLPALKKLDAMLLSILDGFHDSEFYYVDRGVIFGVDDAENLPLSSPGRSAIRQEEKWWLPFPKVPTNGLSADIRKRLEQCRECANQILKAAMAINSNVLAEMEIPSAYSENLPKSGKACLGEMIYHYLTARQFSPESLLDYLDLSSEYTTLEIANRIESAAHIWRGKCQKRHFVRSKNGKSSWGGKVKGFVGEIQRTMLLAKRAETLLHNLRLRFPGLPQTALDMSKIQYNKDVGHAIIESYSRVMESLAFNIMGRIDDLLYVDDATKQRAAAEAEMKSLYQQDRSCAALPKQKRISNSKFSIEQSSSVSSYKKSTFDSSNEVARILNRKTHHSSLNNNNLRGTLDQTLEKLTF